MVYSIARTVYNIYISYLLGLRISRCQSVNKIFFRAPAPSVQAIPNYTYTDIYIYIIYTKQSRFIAASVLGMNSTSYNDHEIGCQSIMLTAILYYYGLKIESNGIRAVICTCLIHIYVYIYYRWGRV